jgi:RNA polymerase sigma-70 factor (ECF subfamily)
MEEFNRALAAVIPNLRRYARVLTRGTSADRADDLVQETLCRALQKAHLFQPGSNLRAWVLTLMHNQHVNLIRQSVRTGTVIPIEDLDGGSVGELTAGERQTDGLRLRDLRRAVDGLPEEQRQTVLLIGLEGLSYKAAAEVLGIPVGTVRSRLSRARAAMRRAMRTGRRAMTPHEIAAPDTAAAA